MRAIIEIFLAIIFTVTTGTSILNFSSKTIKKEAIIKIQKGLPSLEAFTKKMTKK
tara:strand:- start:140548 stop:140712 length:165 start_codon:yes stop_codon:yes gene_type:complete